jgi:hypothetical protein
MVRFIVHKILNLSGQDENEYRPLQNIDNHNLQCGVKVKCHVESRMLGQE